MHTNSLTAYDHLSAHLNKRERIVLAVYAKHHPTPLSDKYVMQLLEETDPNRVRPRVTDLIGKKLLRETGKKRCEHTGCVCRHSGLNVRQGQMELAI